MSAARKIAVLGGGAWGTALAATAARAGHRTVIWARDAAIARAINERGENPRYLPGIHLSDALEAVSEPALALDGAEIVLSVVPAQALREALSDIAPLIAPGTPNVICAKGIERDSGKRMSEIAGEVLAGSPPAILSGPSFATDVARGLPTAVTIAARDATLAARLAAILSTPSFRCYSTDDIVGVEIGGALKNVLAIAAGAVSGAGLGASAQAALVTRGFVELRRIGTAFGARAETLMGLSGLGDLILTCGSPQSRNFAYGLAIGRGEALDGLPLAEGVATAAVAARIARESGIDAPIIDAVHAILERSVTIGEAVASLLSRPLKSEFE